MAGLIQFCRRTRKKAAQLHFKKRKTRGEARIAEPTFYARSAGIGSGFHGNPRDGATVYDARRKNFGWFVRRSGLRIQPRERLA